MRRHLLSLRYAFPIAGMLLLVLFVAATSYAQSSGEPCVQGDVNCDGRIDVADLQQIAGAIQSTPRTDPARLDLNGDGVVDLTDLQEGRRRWRGATRAATEEGRFGYGVDSAGNVFLRWALTDAVDLYTTPVEVLREPAPAGSPSAGVGSAGIVATVSPITDDATALPLLDEHWETLRNGYERDGDGNPIPLNSISQIHAYVQAGDNPMLVSWLASRNPGVAQVFGLGYLDTDFSGTGVHRYWIRVGAGQPDEILLGPVEVDTTRPTRLPNPSGVNAFDAGSKIEANLPVPSSGALNDAVRLRALRQAHANIYLTWNLDLDLPETDPVWQNGFNVYRRTCDPGPVNCSGWERINEYPVFPQPQPEDVSAPEDVSGGRLAYGVEAHEFEYHWADFDLDTSRMYCYSVTSLDLLQQDGSLSPQTCLQPPDYRPPGAPDLLRVETVYNGKGNPADVQVVFTFDPAVEGNEDWQRFELYRAKSALAVWPDEWERIDILTPDVCREEMVLSDSGLQEHQDYWYRVVAVDKRGNMSAPSAPQVSKVDDIYPPAAPIACTMDILGNPKDICFLEDDDVETVEVYRKFSLDGVAVLVDQVDVSPGESFVWTSWSDDYAPLRETPVWYEIRGVDEAGNLGDASAFTLTRVLSPGVAQQLIPPAILEARVDSGFQGRVTWTTVGEQNLEKFIVYRAKGEDRPTDVAAMSQIGEILVNGQPEADRTFEFIDSSSVLQSNNIFWYAVEAVDVAGNRAASRPYPARYVGLDESERYQQSFTIQVEWVSGPPDGNGVAITIDDPSATNGNRQCCYIVFRSQNGVDGFTPISPIIGITDNLYDLDVHPGDTAYYQLVRISAGTFDGTNIDPATARGEITAKSNVIQATIPDKPLPSVAHTPPESGTFTPGPGDPPATLRFGTWDVTVTSYSNKTAGNLAGNGQVTLRPSPGANTPVKVTFSGVSADGNGNVSGGSGDVLLGTMAVERTNRVRYTVKDMTLDKFGAKATVRIYDFGPDFTPYKLQTDGPGYPVEAASQGVLIEDDTLRFSHVLPVSQTCLTPKTSIVFPFGVRDWSLTVVPTSDFTIDETGVQFGSTCTLYRDRFMQLAGQQGTLDYRNDGFMEILATDAKTGLCTGTGDATYSVKDGLNGCWVSVLPHTYTTAYPFGVEVGSSARSFRFVDGQLSQGRLTRKLVGDSLSLDYRKDTDGFALNSFSGNYVQLDITANGGITGTVTSTDTITWTEFRAYDGDYALYIPPVMTSGLPNVSWPASLGAAASGLPGDERAQPGLNAYGHDLDWTPCPTPAAPSPLAFPFTGGSDVDLYVRRSGVSGVVNMQPASPLPATLADYQFRISRFAQSWLSNWPYDSASAGKFYLPYPAEAIFQFDQLLLDEAGCVVGGALLPKEEDLDYWQVTVLPWAIFFDDADKLWIELEAQIANLERLDGNRGDPLVEMALAFNPDGTPYDGEVYPEDTVYTVDDFYVVMQDLRLSDYDPALNLRERPGWDRSATLAPAPCLPQQNGCTATPGLEGGFVELSAGVYLPFFGEATDPNADHMYLLGGDPYVGFDKRPLAEHVFSPALDIQLQYELLYAQSQGTGVASRWVGLATSQGRDISVLDNKLAEVTIAEIPNALVVEPDTERIFFGFPSATGMFLAANEAWVTLPGNDPAGSRAELEQRFLDWCSGSGGDNGPLFSLFGAGWDCALEAKLAAYLAKQEGFDDYRTLIDDVDAKAEAHGGIVSDWLTDGAFADVHVGLPLFQQKLANSPLQLQWVRGDATVRPVTDSSGRIIGGELDLLQADAYVTVYDNERDPAGPEPKTLLAGDFSMEWDPNGSVYLNTRDLGTTMADLDVRLDADMRLLFDLDDLGYGIEGGVTLYDIETQAATVDKAGAVAGFTVDDQQIVLLYTGASLDLWVELETIGRINVGGAFLFGRLDPSSPVLEQEYGDIMAAMDPDPGMVIQGAYMQLYANNIVIFDLLGSCPGVRISGGGEVAFWVFTEAGQPNNAWGVRLGVNATGKALCVAAVKASVTLQLDNDFGSNALDLTGDAWAGAGCGFCEPEKWTTKQKVREDKGCIKCILTLDFVIPLKGSTTEADFNWDGECPF